MIAFGPYKQKQVIDFRCLGEESIFLITGPTGAGKTTIFDAICYALYGRASGSEREHDSFRSDFAHQDQLTSVSFSFRLRETNYLVKRQPKQWRPKERGEGFREEPTQASFYEVIDDKEILIHSKVKDVNEKIEQLLGLNYDQFRKMIMIPQGEFRKLIAENSKEREEILQKIFRTYFYRDLTQSLKTEAKEKKEQLKQVEWKIEQELDKLDWDEIETFTTVDQIIEALQFKLQQASREIKEVEEKYSYAQKRLEEKRQAYFEGKKLAEQFSEQTHLRKEQTELDQARQEIDKKRVTLTSAKKAQQLIPLEQQVTHRKKEWESQLNKVQNLKQEVTVMTKQLKLTLDQYHEFEQEEKLIEQKKLKLETEKNQLNKRKQYDQVRDDRDQLGKKRADLLKIERTLRLQINDDQEVLQSIDKQLDQHVEITDRFYKKKEIVTQLEIEKEKSEKLLQEFDKLILLRSSYKKVEDNYLSLKKKCSEQEEKIKVMERQQRNMHAYIIAKHLHEGEGCPVCGSQTHPHLAEASDERFSEQAYEQLEQALRNSRAQLDTIQDQLIQAKSQGQSQRQIVEDLANNFDYSSEQLDRSVIQTLNQKINLEFNEQKTALKIFDEEKAQLSHLKEKKKKKKEQLQSRENELNETIKKIEQLNTEATKLTGYLEQLDKELPSVNITIHEWQEEIDKQEQELNQWYENWKKLKMDKEEAQLALAHKQSLLSSYEDFSKKTEEAWQKEQECFINEVQLLGFRSKEEFAQAKRSNEHINQMEHEIKQFEQREERISQRLIDLEKGLKDKKEPNLDLLNVAVEESVTEVERYAQELTEIKHKERILQSIFKKLENLQVDQKSIQQEYYDIAELANLTDGDNHLRLSFERYVLSSFLDEILLQANIRMAQLTEHRYQLIRSHQVAKHGAKSGLDLEVMDQHTGKKRSVRTLSGGEGFKAALSLALGMADVVQAHAGGVQLDTLFIDEGFGTLDELSLAQAIDCLKSLQQSDRLLGIISHVGQLKEEIYAKLQIEVSPQGSTASFHL